MSWYSGPELGCRCRKVAFISVREARNSIRRLERQGAARPKVYSCPDVPKLWHLTYEGKRR